MREKEKVVVEVISEREAKRRFRKPGKPVLQIYSPEGKIAEWKSEDIPDLYCDFCCRILEGDELFLIDNHSLVCKECYENWRDKLSKDEYEVIIRKGVDYDA